MLKVVAFLFCMLVSTELFAQDQQPQVMIMPHTTIRANYGESYLEYALPRYHHSNSFKVYYLPSATCPVAPQVTLQVRYQGNINWHNMAVQGGVFKHSGFKLDAIKLIFKQYSYPTVECVMYVLGVDSTITTNRN